jgi:hypothetical protein
MNVALIMMIMGNKILIQWVISGDDCFWAYFSIFEIITASILSKDLCALITVTQVQSTLQVPFSIVLVSIHRLCIIVYNTNNFFKTKRWVLTCIFAQWMLGILLALLTLAGMQTVRCFFLWRIKYWYIFLLNIVLLYIIFSSNLYIRVDCDSSINTLYYY